jgi:hypothetical protein
MAISQRVYVTNMTCGMFSGAFSLYWLRARARGTSLPLSLLHIHRPPMNTFCKVLHLLECVILLQLLATTGRGRIRSPTSNSFCQRQAWRQAQRLELEAL